MSDEPATDPSPSETGPPLAAKPRPMDSRVRRRLWSRLGRWLGEFTTVFVGVYAAFLLGNHASQRQARQRREQILVWVDEYYTQVLNNAETQLPKLKKMADDFNRPLAAGQMPEVKPINWVGDYDPADSTSVLQSGGYDLLAIDTVRDMRNVESTLRQLVSMAQHLQQRSDAMILPNRGKDLAIFYDPATQQLRGSYAWYPKTFQDEMDCFEDLRAKTIKLLAQVRADRAQGR